MSDMSDFEADDDGYVVVNIKFPPKRRKLPQFPTPPVILEIDTVEREIQDDQTSDQPGLFFYGKRRQYVEIDINDTQMDNTCIQIIVPSSPEPTIGKLKSEFAKALATKEKGMLLYHLSYKNNVKFGMGDIRLPDGRIGRFLDPDYKTISHFDIKSGDFFEIDFK